MCFNFSAVFGINQSTKVVYNFKPTESHVVGSVEAMFNALKADSKISESDIKEQRLSLRVYVYEAQSVSSTLFLVASGFNSRARS